MTAETQKQVITVATTVNAPPERVWDMFTNPLHIIHWYNASDDWQTSYAENDLRPGGAFLSRMEARDGSEGFDFSGRFLSIESLREIVDGKEVTGDEAASTWRGSLENYSLKHVGSKTLLSVDTDIPTEMRSFLTETRPASVEPRTNYFNVTSR